LEQKQLPLFAIAESQAQNKKTTCKDKLPICDPSTQKQKLSKTLGVDLTSKEKVCVPYWTDFCEEISSKLLLPVETDCVDSDLSLYSTWSNKTVEKSWFRANLFIAQKQNLPRIFSASSTSSLVGCMDLESTVRKSKKIKICLDQVQKNLIKRWVGTSRFVFNETVKYLQQPGSVANWKAIKTEIIQGLPEWSKDIPYQIKSIAIKDACLAVKEAKKKYKQTGKINKVKFRSRRDKIQSCYIPKSAVTDKGIYHPKLGSIRFTEKLPTKIGDCRLVSHLGITYYRN